MRKLFTFNHKSAPLRDISNQIITLLARIPDEVRKLTLKVYQGLHKTFWGTTKIQPEIHGVGMVKN